LVEEKTFVQRLSSFENFLASIFSNQIILIFSQKNFLEEKKIGLKKTKKSCFGKNRFFREDFFYSIIQVRKIDEFFFSSNAQILIILQDPIQEKKIS